MDQVASQTRKTQEIFFRYIFKRGAGTVCLAKLHREEKQLEQQFFEYEYDSVDTLLDFCDLWGRDYDLYIAPFFLNKRKRTKETIESCPCVYSDLDTCHPDKMLVTPTFVIESSPNRYQAMWVFSEPIDPQVAENISKRIAYYHANDGADKTGWDLTQLLRIPGTLNLKYAPEEIDVKIIKVDPRDQSVEELLAAYPEVEDDIVKTDIPMPDESELDNAENIIEKYEKRITLQTLGLIQSEPKEDWSKSLWSLENLLYEAGLDRNECFVVSRVSACNKYKRDNKPEALLWNEVCKVYGKRDAAFNIKKESEKTLDKSLLTLEEQAQAAGTRTIIEEYTDWATALGDAAPQYHQASAFMMLSALLAGSIKLPTSFGTVLPNLWFMILADTTLTRKTTAMDLAIELLSEIDSNTVLATDGSIEGLFTALSVRPGVPSIFLRDEFSGLLEAMNKKEYMAGMGESLTKLYDGKFQKRILRKETIEVREPVLLIFAGGIKTKILQLLRFEDVASGFMPRFIFITAESDISKMKPLGPPTISSTSERERIRGRFATIGGHYSRPSRLSIGDKIVEAKAEWKAELTPAAWERYNKIETELLSKGLNSPNKEILTPTFDRMSKSGLKAAILIAAARRLEEKVVVTEEDLLKAFSYIDKWRPYTLEVVSNIGKSSNETLISKVLKSITESPGIFRSTIMQNHRLSARDASAMFATMEERNLITKQKQGRAERYWPVN